MKIVNKDEKKKVAFQYIPYGGVFKREFEDNSFNLGMKIEELYDEKGYNYHAVDLSLNCVIHVDDNEMVTPLPDAQLII